MHIVKSYYPKDRTQRKEEDRQCIKVGGGGGAVGAMLQQIGGGGSKPGFVRRISI